MCQENICMGVFERLEIAKCFVPGYWDCVLRCVAVFCVYKINILVLLLLSLFYYCILLY
jgi:hypothetical protein